MVSLGSSFPQFQLSPARWNQRLVFGGGALLAALLLWLYVDLLHEQVRRAETVREAFSPRASLARATAPTNLANARATGPLPTAVQAAVTSRGSAVRGSP